MYQASAQDRNSRPVVTAMDATSPMRRPNRPATAAPNSGPNTRMSEDQFHCVRQPFITLAASSTLMSPRLRKKVTRMAKPTAASAAATVSTNMAKIWPTTSCR